MRATVTYRQGTAYPGAAAYSRLPPGRQRAGLEVKTTSWWCEQGRCFSCTHTRCSHRCHDGQLEAIASRAHREVTRCNVCNRLWAEHTDDEYRTGCRRPRA